MLTVILTILKVIGIIIGIILGILLLLIAEILWVPFRYKVIAKKEEDFSVQVKLHWLLRFIFVDLTYENSNLVFLIRVLGYRVYDSRRPKKEKKRKKKKKVKKSKKKSSGKEGKNEKSSVPQELPTKSEESKDTKQVIVIEGEAIEAKEPSKQKPSSMKNRIRRILSSIKSFPGKVKSAFVRLIGIGKKIKGIIRKIASFPVKIKNLIFDETTSSAFALIWKTVRDLLRALGPKRIRGHVEFGLEDPSSTGMAIGAISVAMSYLNIRPKKVQVIPDFTRARLTGEIKAMGRVYSFTVLRLFLKLYRDENIKNLKQRIDQFKEG